MLISGPVQNYSLTDRSLRLVTQITIGYQSDVEQILRLLEETVAAVDRVSDAPAPQALLLRFGADGLELEVGFWIPDPENGRGNALSDVNRAIWKMLQAQKVEVPFPQRDIRIIDGRNSTESKISELHHASGTQ
jgi:small-conductance mechanosensitive channel